MAVMYLLFYSCNSWFHAIKCILKYKTKGYSKEIIDELRECVDGSAFTSDGHDIALLKRWNSFPSKKTGCALHLSFKEYIEICRIFKTKAVCNLANIPFGMT